LTGATRIERTLIRVDEAVTVIIVLTITGVPEERHIEEQVR